MAFSATVVWEVRSTASDSNGGGFNSAAGGTDYSQQDSAQFTGTDLAGTNANTATPTVTSASHNFVAADVGNIIQINSGTNWIAGFYEIKSVASNAATLDRACASVASPTNGTWHEGGALASPGMAFGAKNHTQGSTTRNGVGNDVWIKAGTYLITSATPNVSGGVPWDNYNSNNSDGGVDWTNIARYRGYQTTRGDNGTRPIIKASGISSTALWHMNGQWTVTEHLEFDGNSGTSIDGWVADNFYNIARDCVARNTTRYGFLVDDNGSSTWFCRATGCSGTAAFKFNDALGANQMAFGCVADSNSCTGFLVGQYIPMVHCIAANNTGAGFAANQLGTRYFNCTAYGNTGSGFDNGFGFVNHTVFFNCVAEANGAFGWGNSGGGAADDLWLFNCAGYNNTSGNVESHISSERIIGFVTGTGSFFTNAAAGDFSLNNTAGAGAALRAAGLPGTFPLTTTVGYLDIGAVQHQDSGGAAPALDLVSLNLREFPYRPAPFQPGNAH